MRGLVRGSVDHTGYFHEEGYVIHGLPNVWPASLWSSYKIFPPREN
jgi:hypothetical protein